MGKSAVFVAATFLPLNAVGEGVRRTPLVYPSSPHSLGGRGFSPDEQATENPGVSP